MSDQDDFFRPAQFRLGLEDTRPDPRRVDPQEVREELNALLATARAALDAAPWDWRMQRYHRKVFPQMASWLPDEEAAQLCFAFAAELDRIEPMLEAA